VPTIGYVLRQDTSSAAGPTQQGSGPARPDWITSELIALTLATWQPYYTETLTDDDAVEMLMTVGNLYRVLAGGSDEQQHEGGEGRRKDAA
jgi:hypothetical protein